MRNPDTIFFCKRTATRVGFSAAAILLIAASIKAVQIGEYLASVIYLGFSFLTMLFVHRAEDLRIERLHSDKLRFTSKTTWKPPTLFEVETSRIKRVVMSPISIGRNPNFEIWLELDSPKDRIKISRYSINKRWDAEQIVQSITGALN